MENMNNMENLIKFTKKELLDLCKKYNIEKCSSKTKPQIIELLSNSISKEKTKTEVTSYTTYT